MNRIDAAVYLAMNLEKQTGLIPVLKPTEPHVIPAVSDRLISFQLRTSIGLTVSTVTWAWNEDSNRWIVRSVENGLSQDKLNELGQYFSRK